MTSIQSNREFMKSAFGALPSGMSDQSKGEPQPPLQHGCLPNAQKIALPDPATCALKERDLYACIKNRRSRRHWTQESLALEELSFLLWATQGVDEILNQSYATLRPVPSGGARHPFETYLVLNRVAGIDPGVYRYLPLTHELVPHLLGGEIHEPLMLAAFGQRFVVAAAAVFVWSCVPYRGEWRYAEAAHKVMLLDAGHIGQNLYLACEAIGAGTCAVGAYDQAAFDQFLNLDGNDEFVVYLAPVGKVPAPGHEG